VASTSAIAEQAQAPRIISLNLADGAHAETGAMHGECVARCLIHFNPETAAAPRRRCDAW
jgi:hypothetical protein